MIDLLTPRDITTVPLTEEATYSDVAIATAARLIIESMEPALPLTYQTVNSMIERLKPWTPVHPKEGKITKRITATLHKQLSASISEAAVQHIGQYLATDLTGSALHYDITDTFNWAAGDFGDHHSCFWSSPGKLLSMEGAGIKALRFYSHSKGEYKGTGRAWVAASPVGHAVLFNAYGPNLEQFKARLKILAPTVPSALVNAIHDDLYINLNSGVLVGVPPEEAPDPLKMDIPYSNRRMFRCPSCGKVEDLDAGRRINGATVCAPCFDKEYGICAHSGHYHPLAELVAVMSVCFDDDTGRYEQGLVKVHNRYIGRLSRCDRCSLAIVGSYPLYVSDRGQRQEFCHLCRQEGGLRDVCAFCGAYKKEDEKCYCRI